MSTPVERRCDGAFLVMAAAWWCAAARGARVGYTGSMVAYLPFLGMVIVLGTGAYSCFVFSRVLWRHGGWRRSVAVGLSLLALLLTLFLLAVVGYELYDAVVHRWRSLSGAH